MMCFSSSMLPRLINFCLGIFTWLVLIMVVRPSAANDLGRPHDENGSTRVHVAIFILDVGEINNVSQSFDANVYFELHWQDPRLTHDGPNEISRSLNDVWHPRIMFINQQKIWPTFPEIVEILPDGEVTYKQRVWGTFSQPLELKDFPFDQQILMIQLASSGYSPQEIELVNDPTSRTGIASRFSLIDWDILGWNMTFEPFQPSLDEEKNAGAKFSIIAKRQYGYFVIKVIIPLFLIVMMSWIVFWIDPKESGTQIKVIITMMLTLIAYRFAVGADLPKLSYLTRIDYLILLATLLVFTSLIEVMVTSTYALMGKLNRARMIDRWARILFPTTFILMAFESLIFRFVL